MINVENDHEPIIYEQPIHSHIYQNHDNFFKIIIQDLYQIIQQRKKYKKQWRSSRRKTHRMLKQKYCLSKRTKKKHICKKKKYGQFHLF